MVSIDQRDYAVVQLVGDFKQLTAAHIHELLFADAQSMNPCYRSLDRLLQRRYLYRLEHRLVGGAQGGSGRYVWELGVEGYRLLTGEASRPIRTINYHTLEIANTYLQPVRLERAGLLKIADYLTEPACHELIGGIQLDPDLYLKLELPGGRQRHIWCEVDMAVKRSESEGRKKIQDKLERYWRIYNTDNIDYWPDYLWQRDADGNPVHERFELDGRVYLEPKRWFPTVVWLVQDEWRLRTLQRLINEGKPERRSLFKVMLLPDFVNWLS